MPRAKPTPMTPPTAAWVVETGSPILEASRTVVAAAKSTEKPRVLVKVVILLPMGIHNPMPGHTDAAGDADPSEQEEKERHRHFRCPLCPF